MPQQAHEITAQITQRVRLGYLLYLPPEYAADPTRQWPLILFLHGAGERGDDLEKLKAHGIPRVVKERDIPFVAVSPQCPEDIWWTAQTEALLALLGHITGGYRVDPARIYLTGLSMGGYGTWTLASAHPERFAAIAPICGGLDGSNYRQKVCTLKDMPIWAFHGAKDNVVPLAATERLTEALKECGGNPRFTIYPEAGHDSWTETYNNPELYTWFLSHTR